MAKKMFCKICGKEMTDEDFRPHVDQHLHLHQREMLKALNEVYPAALLALPRNLKRKNFDKVQKAVVLLGHLLGIQNLLDAPEGRWDIRDGGD